MAHQWVPARTPTVHRCPPGKAVGGPCTLKKIYLFLKMCPTFSEVALSTSQNLPVLLPRSCVLPLSLLHLFSPLSSTFEHLCPFGPDKVEALFCKQCTSHVTFFSCLCALVMMCHTTLAQVFVRVISSMCHAPVCLISLRPPLCTLHLSLSHLPLHPPEL